MTTSFDAMQEETRALALLDDARPAARRHPGMTLASALALVAPILVVILL